MDTAVVSDPSAAIANEDFKAHMFNREAAMFEHDAIGVELKSEIAQVPNALNEARREFGFTGLSFKELAGERIDGGFFNFRDTEDLSGFETTESFSVVENLLDGIVEIELTRVGISRIGKSRFREPW